MKGVGYSTDGAHTNVTDNLWAMGFLTTVWKIVSAFMQSGQKERTCLFQEQNEKKNQGLLQRVV